MVLFWFKASTSSSGNNRLSIEWRPNKISLDHGKSFSEQPLLIYCQIFPALVK